MNAFVDKKPFTIFKLLFMKIEAGIYGLSKKGFVTQKSDST